MEIAPTEKEAGKDRLQLIAHELLLARDACLQFEIKLISLEHVLYNQTVDKYHFNQNDIRKICTNITKLREHVKREYSLLDRAISKVVSHKWIFESEDPQS